MLTALFPGLTPGTRVALAALTALGLVMWAIPWLARLARRRQFGDRADKTFSDQLNSLRAESGKGKTPVVGGIGLFFGVLPASLLFADLTSGGVWMLLGTLIALGLVGFADDYAKTFGGDAKRSGLSARQKLAAQGLVGLALGGLLLWRGAGDLAAATTIAIPFTSWTLGLGVVGFLLLATFLVTGTSNAVNLTDGLDGLAGGCALVAFDVYLAAAAFTGASEVAVVLAALAGGLAGFLIYNRHPAQVFMGDTGSLPLGGALAAAALLTKQELLLAVVGGVFVAEALSVMAQVLCFKLTGKRIFRCAPLHHHFEFKGWSETTVVSRFHAAALLLGLLGLAGMGLTA